MSKVSVKKGLPPIKLSETMRQLIIMIMIILNTLLCHCGIHLMMFSVVNKPIIGDHMAIFRTTRDFSIFNKSFEVLLLSGYIGIVILSCSTIGLFLALCSVSTSQKQRKNCCRMGYIYILALSAAIGFLCAIEKHYQRDKKAEREFSELYGNAFYNAMWDYMYIPRTKDYIDWMQQEYTCCGANGYKDWYITDWIKPSIYKTRYFLNLGLRDQYASSKSHPQYSLKLYGTQKAQAFMHKLAGKPNLTWPFEHELYFNEVPFSCCNPAAESYCRQQFASRQMYAYNPADDKKPPNVHETGCAAAIIKSIHTALRPPWPGIIALIVVKAVILVLYRLLQTSQRQALRKSQGEPTDAAFGYIIPLLCCSGKEEISGSEESSVGTSEEKDKQPDVEAGNIGTGVPAPPNSDSSPKDSASGVTSDGGDTSGVKSDGGDTSGVTSDGGDTSGVTTEGGDTSGVTTEGGDTSGVTTEGGDTSGVKSDGGDTSGVTSDGGDTSGVTSDGGDTSGVTSDGDVSSGTGDDIGGTSISE